MKSANPKEPVCKRQSSGGEKMRDPGEFKLDGEEFGSMSHWGSPDGPLGVDINMDRLTPAEARKLAARKVRSD